MECANCQEPIEDKTHVDYLCPRCRADQDPAEWEERLRVTDAVSKWLHKRAKMYYGVEILFPEGSPWAWVRVFDDPGLAHPENLYGAAGRIGSRIGGSGEVMREYMERLQLPMYVVWKYNGDVYEMEDGEVPDDPIFRLTD